MDYLILKWINNFAGKYLWLDMLGIILAEYLIFFIPLIVFFFFFFLKRKNKIISLFLKIIFSCLIAYFLSYLINLITLRPRPFVNDRTIYQLSKFFVKSTDYSFPSYHTVTVFIFSFIVLLDWKNFGIILLIPACLVGIGRIFIGVHYPSDILGGILTAFIALLIFDLLVKKIFINKIWKH